MYALFFDRKAVHLPVATLAPCIGTSKHSLTRLYMKPAAPALMVPDLYRFTSSFFRRTSKDLGNADSPSL